MFDFCIDILRTLQRQYKTIDTKFMIYLYFIQLVLFCILIANVGKLLTNLLIDKQ